MNYFVSQKSDLYGKGSNEYPFKTISKAAQIAKPGDTVIICDDIYRERVSPKLSGTGNNERITNKNADGEHPCISGA